jgi:hypothetical protein
MDDTLGPVSLKLKDQDPATAELGIFICAKSGHDSTPLAYLTLPVSVCTPGNHGRARIAFTSEPGYTGSQVKATVRLELTTGPIKKPFKGAKCDLDLNFLTKPAPQPYAPQQAYPGQPPFPAGAQPPPFAPGGAFAQPPGSQYIQPLPPPGLGPSGEVPEAWITAAATAIATCPSEMWPIFAEKEFLKDAIQYYRARG